MKKSLVVLSWMIAASGLGYSATEAATPLMVGAPAPESGQFYCPPGAKYCPIPGRDNTTFLDTHFGMDAATGEVKRYTGSVHPNEVVNNLTTKEETLYVSPPISVENRQVPYPGTTPTAPNVASYPSPQTRVAAPQPIPAPAVAVRSPEPADEPRVAARSKSRAETASKIPWWKGGLWRNKSSASEGEEYAYSSGRESEVADQQAVKSTRVDPPLSEDNGEIPWWKGGWFRGKKEPKDESSSSRKSSSSDAKSSAKAKSDQPSAVSPDDMWGDEEEYTGYGDDGGYNQPRARAAAPATDPYADPYAQQGLSQAPYTQPLTSAPTGGGFVGDAYTLPNSPPPTSPYHEGYVYPGSDVTYDNTFQGGLPGQVAQQPQVYQSPIAGQPPVSSSGQPQPGFAMPPPPAMPAPTAPAPSRAAPRSSGTPQFENAVKLVKESRFAEAKSILLSESSSDPGNPAVWRWLGDSQYNLLELQDAINSYQRALSLDPNDYYALRGQGFAHLHRGHELWRKMMEELNLSQRDQAAATFAQAHENYKKSLEKLGECLRRAPNDEEAVYGEAMAAEGASRKLYSNAISYIKLGPENRERAELFAENCLQVINKGVERASDRARSKPGESGPRALLGGLYLRKAMLYHQLGKKDLALAELKNSYGIQKSILDEIDKNNLTAQKGVRDCETYWREWGGTGSL